MGREGSEASIPGLSRQNTSKTSEAGGSFLDKDDRQSNDIDLVKIMNGDEHRTTVMIRNIPNKFK